MCSPKIDYGTKARVALAINLGVGNVEEDQILAALNSSERALRIGMDRSAHVLGQFMADTMRCEVVVLRAVVGGQHLSQLGDVGTQSRKLGVQASQVTIQCGHIPAELVAAAVQGGGQRAEGGGELVRLDRLQQRQDVVEDP